MESRSAVLGPQDMEFRSAVLGSPGNAIGITDKSNMKMAKIETLF